MQLQESAEPIGTVRAGDDMVGQLLAPGVLDLSEHQSRQALDFGAPFGRPGPESAIAIAPVRQQLSVHLTGVG